MARYVAASVGAAASTTARGPSLYSIAAVAGELREVGCFNTTTTAVRNQLKRLTATGTQWSALTEAKYDDDSAAASVTGFTTHTADATAGDAMHVMPMGAAIGSGTILTFYDRGIEWPVGTSNGIGILLASGTGQVQDCHLVWDE